jgi:hypothetical protein
MSSLAYSQREIISAIHLLRADKRIRYLNNVVANIRPDVREWIESGEMVLSSEECEDVSLLFMPRFNPRPFTSTVSESYSFPSLIRQSPNIMSVSIGDKVYQTRPPVQFEFTGSPFALGIVYTCSEARPHRIEFTYEPNLPSPKLVPLDKFIKWKHDKDIYLKHPCNDRLFELDLYQDDKIVQTGLKWTNKKSVYIGVRDKPNDMLQLYDRKYQSRPDSTIIQARRIQELILFEIINNDRAWQYTIIDKYMFATIFEFSGREMIYWDYTDEKQAKRMVCPLFPNEHKQVENLQIPTELEVFVLEFLTPYF